MLHHQPERVLAIRCEGDHAHMLTFIQLNQLLDTGTSPTLKL